MANKNGGFIGTDGLDAPDPPTAVTPTAGDGQLSIAFTAPTDTGTSAITGFVAQVASSGDNYSAGSNTGTSSPIVVSSLSNGTSYTAKVWAINAYGTSAPSDASTGVSPAAIRGLYAGGYNGSSYYNTIDYIEIATTGNATDFGDLATARYTLSGVSSSTRGVFGGGDQSAFTTIEYVTFSTTSNTTDFGDLTVGRYALGGLSNATRGVFAAGYNSSNATTNTLDYITIASAGNATDFGDTTASAQGTSGSQSSTRGIINIGFISDASNKIDYITIASTGNAADFGDLTQGRWFGGACSSSVRALCAGGQGGSPSYPILNIIDYITIASTGNATDFGDLLSVNLYTTGTSNSTRGVFGGSNNSNVIQYVTIASTGNATDFGDLTTSGTVQGTGACSNGHGGLA